MVEPRQKSRCTVASAINQLGPAIKSILGSLGSGCGTVAVLSTRGPGFKSRHRQFLKKF